MLMRKRAWDMAREDYARVEGDASLVEVMRKLSECVKSGNGCLCVLVFEGTELLGAVSIWDTIRFMNSTIRQIGLSREEREWDFENLFHAVCALGAAAHVTDVMDTGYTILAPDMPIPEIMAKLVKNGRSYAVVMEGTRTLGVIMIQDIFVELTDEARSREGAPKE
ncbi:MAG: CBS domain-containing protein [Deltaproteobacteria bacterium]|jgi:CBS domain-containing protein|nr:CBS domain-containing protein [Deltaproteobacteria bacterium]